MDKEYKDPVRILSLILPYIFCALEVIILNFRTPRLRRTELLTIVSGRWRIVIIVHAIVMIPAAIFIAYGDMLIGNEYIYSLSPLAAKIWITGYIFCIMFFLGVALLSRTYIRVFTYVTHVFLFLVNYVPLMDNAMCRDCNYATAFWLALLDTFNIILVFSVPQYMLMNNARYHEVFKFM